MLESRKDLKDKVTALESQLAESEESLANVQASLESVQEDLKSATQDLEATKTELVAKSAELTAATGELEEANGKLATFDDEVDKAAQAKSDQYLSQLGHDPLPEPAGNTPDDPAPEEDAAETLASIDDPAEAYQFARANRNKVVDALFAR